MAVIEFVPSMQGDAGLKSLFEYFSSRKRYAVVGQLVQPLKDFYIIPVRKNEPLPHFMNNSGDDSFSVCDQDRLFGLLVFKAAKQPQKSVEMPNEPYVAPLVSQTVAPTVQQIPSLLNSLAGALKGVSIPTQPNPAEQSSNVSSLIQSLMSSIAEQNK